MAYNDIDSNKVLNKVGLLELSGQIKGYINANMPQPSNQSLPILDLDTLLANSNATWQDWNNRYRITLEGANSSAQELINQFTYATNNFGVLDGYSCILFKGTFYLHSGNNTFKTMDWGNATGNLYARTLTWDFTDDYLFIIYTSVAGDFNYTAGQGINISGRQIRVSNDIYNLITRVPAAPTTDGTYILQCVVSSGAPTYSWVSTGT